MVLNYFLFYITSYKQANYNYDSLILCSLAIDGNSLVDDNTRKMEMFDTAEGEKEYKTMELVMTRKK